jgi:hypothetical protein
VTAEIWLIETSGVYGILSVFPTFAINANVEIV